MKTASTADEDLQHHHSEDFQTVIIELSVSINSAPVALDKWSCAGLCEGFRCKSSRSSEHTPRLLFHPFEHPFCGTLRLASGRESW